MKLMRALSHPFRMLRIVRFVWKARRPSTMHDMPAVVDTFWIKSGYTALTFFGAILTRSQSEADAMNGRLTTLKNHEMIHLKQAQSLHNSWFLFYVRYIWYYVRAIPQNKYMRNAAYYLNPFEMEAYEHMYEKDYLEKCKDGANGWRVYAKMKPKARRELSKR